MSIHLEGVYCTARECTLKSVLDLIADQVALLFSSVNNVKWCPMGPSPARLFTKQSPGRVTSL